VTVKVVNPGLPTPVRTVAYNPQTRQTSANAVGIELKKCKGDTLIRKDVIDLQRDIIDLDEFLSKVPEDTLFLALMRGQAEGLSGNKALEMGLIQLMDSDNDLEERLKQELKNRLEKKQ